MVAQSEIFLSKSQCAGYCTAYLTSFDQAVNGSCISRLKPPNSRRTDQPKTSANSHNTTASPLGLLFLLMIANSLTAVKDAVNAN